MTFTPVENPRPTASESEQPATADTTNVVPAAVDLSKASLGQVVGLLIFRPVRTYAALRRLIANPGDVALDSLVGGIASPAAIAPKAPSKPKVVGPSFAKVMASHRHLDLPSLMVALVAIALLGSLGITNPVFRRLIVVPDDQAWPFSLGLDTLVATVATFNILLAVYFSAFKVIAIPRFYAHKLLAALGALAIPVLIFLFPDSARTLLLNTGQYLVLLALASMFLLIVINVKTGRLEALRPREARAEPLSIERLAVMYGLRLALLGIVGLLSYQVWDLTKDNILTDSGFMLWMLSIVGWFVFLFDYDSFSSPQRWLQKRWDGIRQWLSGKMSITLSWTHLALIGILLMGAWFRFRDLSSYPPDMTSDHVEMVLDVWRVENGQRSIFFANNGGREGFNMYYLAALQQATNLPIDFILLKVGSGLQGMLLILLGFWAGRAIFGEENRKFGNLVGLIAAAMLASSYWEVVLSRLGERLALTAVAAMLVTIFLARAIRHNRRLDWILAGLALGAGLYFYQAIRMMPVVVVVALVLALVWRARNTRQFAAYLVNFTALVVMAAVVFVPLARYWDQFPRSFWERTSGRLFGEDVIEVKDSAGIVIERRLATLGDRLEAFSKTFPALSDTYRRSLLMFNVHGDNAWITGDPSGTPELDFMTGMFFLLGVGVIGARMIKRRDPVDWLLVAGVLIMILPTALSIAFVIEVPSASRASGAIPFVYLIAALGMATIITTLVERVNAQALKIGIYGVAILSILMGAAANAQSYFVSAMSQYRNSTLPHHQAGTLMADFINSTGAPGNAFMIGWPNGWDHRALGIEAGQLGWPNGILWDKPLENVITFMMMNVGTRFELRPDRQMLFFLTPTDTASLKQLQTVFGEGQVLPVKTFKADRDFVIYIAKPVGCDWFKERFKIESQSCKKPEAAGGAGPITSTDPAQPSK